MSSLRGRDQKPENLRELRGLFLYLFVIFVHSFGGREADLLVAGVDNEGPSLYFMVDNLIPCEVCLQWF